MTCFHCRADIPSGVIIEERCDGEILQFCCNGCRGAYLLITHAGLNDFYTRREWPEQTDNPAGTFQTQYHDSQLARYMYPCDGWSAVDIIIEGIRCATCVWLNEKMIGRLPGVRDIRVNYATSRARVIFDPEQVGPAAIFSRIAELGYIPRPFTRSAAEESADRERKDLLIRFGTAFFLTMQLMSYSFALYAGYFQGIGPTMKHYLQLFSLLTTAPVIFYAGWPFLRGAWLGIVNRAPTMELLIAIGALSSFIYSIFATFTGGEVYFETAAMIITLILAGRLLENGAKRRAAGGIERLMELTVGEAQRLVDDRMETVDVADIRPDDIILVGSGQRFPVDGFIREGSADVDESPATGEPLPVVKGAGDPVIAGSINLTGTVGVICRKQASDSFIARVARLVEEAQNRRAPIQRMADVTAAYFVPAVLLLAAATFFWQYHLTNLAGPSLMTALAVVVIACPCALGLATPTAILAGTGAAAASGIFFKGGDILERLSKISMAVFDKTGTITCGKPVVLAAHPSPGFTIRDMIACAAAVESGSLHPIGQAICAHAKDQAIPYTIGSHLVTVAGGGVSGTVHDQQVAVGSLRFLTAQGIGGIPPRTDTPPGGTVVHVACSGTYAGTITVEDRLREEAPKLLGYFRENALQSVLLSGDRQETVEHVAHVLQIGKGIGEMLPEDKVLFIEKLRKQEECVLMIGDGINDAPALSAADVGCALAGGTDIALETCDLVVAKPDLERIATAHGIARQTMRVIRQNLCWPFIYNLIGIPLAMTGRLTPVYAAAAMALSSLFVVGNSLRLTVIKHG